MGSCGESYIRAQSYYKQMTHLPKKVFQLFFVRMALHTLYFWKGVGPIGQEYHKLYS